MERFHENKVMPSLFHGLWDGCDLKVYFDPLTTLDIIIHDRDNTTYTSMKTLFNNNLYNPTYILGQYICAKKAGDII